MSICRRSSGSVILAAFDRFQLCEPISIGQRLVEPVLGFDLGSEIFVPAGRIGGPPGSPHGDVERANLALVVRDELRGLLVAGAGGRCLRSVTGLHEGVHHGDSED